MKLFIAALFVTAKTREQTQTTSQKNQTAYEKPRNPQVNWKAMTCHQLDGKLHSH